jgi:putative ABC transport system ATP-binding protein
MPLIEVDNIRKTYITGDSSFNALENVSLSIKAGEFVSIMGPSGSGKSTFMNILGCLDKPTDGNYFLDDIDIMELDRDKLAAIRNEKIGFIFQGFNLVSRTSAIENIELPMIYKGVPPKERQLKVIKALESVGLSERGHHTPNQLSGGQQQRVAIARAIVNDAPIILADEPTGNLDTKTSCEIMDLFVKLNRESGKTIILVTHEPDIAEYSRRIIKFKDGNLVKDEVKSQ